MLHAQLNRWSHGFEALVIPSPLLPAALRILLMKLEMEVSLLVIFGPAYVITRFVLGRLMRLHFRLARR